MHEVAEEAVPDIPADEPYSAGSFERWRQVELEGPMTPPEATFMAIGGDEVVGYAMLWIHHARRGVASHGLTAVKRAWRGRGVAGALKAAEIRWAKDAGLTELETENEARNVGMLAINRRLGYEPLPGWIYFTRPSE